MHLKRPLDFIDLEGVFTAQEVSYQQQQYIKIEGFIYSHLI